MTLYTAASKTHGATCETPLSGVKYRGEALCIALGLARHSGLHITLKQDNRTILEIKTERQNHD